MLPDEPTNHLDVGAREAIEGFLAESPATILVVSHDRRFLETICERLWVVDAGLVPAFGGRPPAPAPPGPPGLATGTAPRRSRPAAVTASRQPKLSKDAYRRQREAVDAELTRLGLRKKHLELSMGDPAVRR